jgi:DNA-binding transcriptional ArsR family regulator
MDREPREFEGRDFTPAQQPERHQMPAQEPAREPQSVAPGSRDYRSQPSRPGRPRTHLQSIRDRENRPSREPERDRSRTAYPVPISDRERNLLAEIGRFRVIRSADLREAFFSGNDRTMTETLVKLRSAGLIEDHLIRRRAGGNAPEPAKVRLISLTPQGKRLASSQPGRDREQRLYAGFVKPREALHDSNLYPVYRTHAARLERGGATVRRVVLDFELKREYLRELRRRERATPGAPEEALKTDAAARFDLPVVNGRVQFPDLRIEYEDRALGQAKVDIELATAAYSRPHLAGKVQAGFTLYASPGDQGRVGAAIHDDHDLVGEILSF